MSNVDNPTAESTDWQRVGTLAAQIRLLALDIEADDPDDIPQVFAIYDKCADLMRLANARKSHLTAEDFTLLENLSRPAVTLNGNMLILDGMFEVGKVPGWQINKLCDLKYIDPRSKRLTDAGRAALAASGSTDGTVGE